MTVAVLYGMTFDGTFYREYRATWLTNAYHDLSINLLIEIWQGFKGRITIK